MIIMTTKILNNISIYNNPMRNLTSLISLMVYTLIKPLLGKK